MTVLSQLRTGCREILSFNSFKITLCHEFRIVKFQEVCYQTIQESGQIKMRRTVAGYRNFGREEMISSFPAAS